MLLLLSGTVHTATRLLNLSSSVLFLDSYMFSPRINLIYLSDQSGVLLRSFRFGDLNFELSTEADRFRLTERGSRLSVLSCDLRLGDSP